MRIVTWNVNGLRAVIKKDFVDIYKSLKADAFCLQETKLQKDQIPVEIEKLSKISYWSFAVKKGYSGTGVILKKEPVSVSYGIGSKDHDAEGRTVTIEFEDFYLVNAYVPNAQPELKRLDFRTKWEDKILKYMMKLDKVKPVVYCGDLNVAHEEIDLKNPKSNVGMPGFSDEERSMMSNLLKNGFVDVFRRVHGEKVQYTWWSYRANARANNTGWRIDYFIVSERFMSKVKDIIIHDEIMGSDHCPVELVLKK